MTDQINAPDPVASPFSNIPVEVTVSVGKTRPRVRDLMAMGADSVLHLDRRVEDPVELYVGDQLIATGELIELDGEDAGKLAVRLIDVRRPDGAA